MANIDPTMPYTEITIDGETYKMAASHRALAIAEDYLVRAGHDCNILLAKLKPSLRGIRAQFAASLHHYHPEVPFETALDLVNDGNLLEVIQTLQAAGKKAEPEVKPLDPPTPGDETK